MSIHDAGRPAEPGAGAGPQPSAGAATEVSGAPAGPGGRTGIAGPASQPRAAQPPGRAGGLARRVPPRWRLPLATYLVCQAIFLAWWAAFYPGLMTYDSAIYVLHVTVGPWVANHSVLYDAMVWLSLHASGGLAGLTLAQTAAMSAALGYTVAAFRCLGVPARWTAIAAVIVAALPPTGMIMVFVWKDVPYAICGFLIVPTLAHLLSLRGRPDWRRDRRLTALIAALGLEMLGLSLFRDNGFTIVAIAAILMVCLLPGVRVRLATAAVAAISLAFLLNFVVYPAAGIQRPPSSLAYGPAYADIAVVYAGHPSIFTPADQRLMARVAPLASWKKSANCYNSGPTDALPGFAPGRFTAQQSSRLFALWLRVLGRSPQLILGARICRGSIAWSIFQGRSGAEGATIKPRDTIPRYLAGLVQPTSYRAEIRPQPLSWPLHAFADSLWQASGKFQLDWLLWRGAFWCYLAYLMLYVFARARRDWMPLSLGAIVAGQQLAILGTVPAQVYRYMLAPILIGIMLVPLFLARNRPASAIGDS
jgi:hypothetical protein